MKLGIVPAGGKATRFGGVFKELLPLMNGKTVLENCIESLDFCDKIMVLTNQQKVSAHAYVLRNKSRVVLSVSDDTLWASIALSFPFRAERSYFLMPDTYFRPVLFKNQKDFEMLVFKTSHANRYGVLQDGCIMDKSSLIGEYLAWGALSWTDKVVDLWKDKIYFNHTDALNDAINTFGYDVSSTDFYYDFASIEDYKLWLTQRST